MKNTFIKGLAVVAVFSTISCNDSASAKISDEDVKIAQANNEAASKLPVIEFDKAFHDFGTINEGEVVTTEFMVKNVGTGNLVIVNAKGSCGCTVPEFEKGEIKPGQSTPIKVTFDSTNKPGQQEKTVTLTTNTATGTETCSIKANVTPNPKNVAKKSATLNN
jgi:hypothetical protein